MSDFPIQFDHPGWLLLLLLLVPAFLMSRKSIGGLSRSKAYTAFAVRAIVILLLTASLSQPYWEKRGEGLTVTVILDRSNSIPLALKRLAVQFLQDATEDRHHPEDRLALITVGQDAMIVSMPDKYSAIGDILEPPDLDGTNLAEAIRTALAIAPDDTANRFLIVSDGNETEGSLAAAAELARANSIPIDVLVLEYEHDKEVIFERLDTPARARLGSSAQVRMVLRSQSEATGQLRLKMNDDFLDLNGDGEGMAMPVTLQPGPTVIPVTVSLDVAGPVQFEAVFEPAAGDSDGVTRNNTAVGVTFVGSEGKVLIVDETDGVETQFLIAALREEGISAELAQAAVLARGPVFLSGYDAIVLANIPRFAVTDAEDRALHAYVHDLGGGLVMLGGPDSFGAGGWIDSQVAKALPVKLDPPQTRQIVRGALALIMHSCEMPQGNYWGQKVAIAAIEALSRLDYVGIIDYDWSIGGVNWTFDLQEAGDKTAAIAAAKKMVMGDMPDFGSAMQVALDGLVQVPAGQRHMIIISDGDPQGPSPQLVQNIINAQITVTTVLVAGHGTLADMNKMKAIATATGGNFYNPKNPKNLPQIFIKEAQIVSRSLIVEGDVYQPQFVSYLPGPLDGFAAVPALHGYILTAPREGLSQIPLVNATTEGNDPVYAYWNYGLGKSIAFTSDLNNRWGSLWASWGEFKAFWEQSIRWVMRPSTPSNLMINTTQEGDRAVVDIEALDADSSFLNFMRTNGIVLRPDAETEPLVLQQTGPGRYRGEFTTDTNGAYLVNINFVGGNADSPLEGNVQAAISVPYPREYKAVKHNAALLRDIAQETGGRVLGNDARIAGLFDPGTLEVPRSPRAVWDLLAILAAVIFIIDVATRRISLDRRAMTAAARRAVGKRAEVGSGTVAAWKRVASRRDRPAVAAAEARQRARARFEAEEGDVATAIDVSEEAAGDPDAARPRRPNRAAQEPEPEPESDEGDYTSRLLKAKRRARGDKTDDGEPAG